MRNKPNIDGFESVQLYVYGKDLRRVRCTNDISLAKACSRMNKSGYGYYPSKLFYYEKKSTVCFPPSELVELVSAIGGTLNVIHKI